MSRNIRLPIAVTGSLLIANASLKSGTGTAFAVTAVFVALVIVLESADKETK